MFPSMKQRLAGIVVFAGVCMACADGGTASGETANAPAATPTVAPPSDRQPTTTPPPASTTPPVGETPPTADCTGKLAQPLDATWKLTSGGRERIFDVHVPASYAPSKRIPVVFDFHGFTSDEKQQALLSGMNKKADEAGFVAVHPRGTGAPLSWNAGACCGQASSENVDDVGFVREMIDALETKLCVDSKRIFATGMSNGGFLSHRLACELSDRIAAVAPVAGVLGIETCRPTRAVPVMQFHGTLDTLVPYLGEPMKGFPSVAKTMQSWADRDACGSLKTESYKKVDARCETYGACVDGTTVTLCTIEGGGHTWPGGLPVPALGHTTAYLSATDAMWDFFVAHPMR